MKLLCSKPKGCDTPVNLLILTVKETRSWWRGQLPTKQNLQDDVGSSVKTLGFPSTGFLPTALQQVQALSAEPRTQPNLQNDRIIKVDHLVQPSQTYLSLSKSSQLIYKADKFESILLGVGF